ncbi:MAG: DNA primase [Nocardioides sp.]|nr:DNA primase [Nocardioides sp.]
MSPRGRIRDEDIAAVREKARIEEVVDPYTTLKRAGHDAMKGLCPFHDEKTPSFQVTPSLALFYCHGCQMGGDVIRFVQEIEGLAFPDAIRHVARLVGVELREETEFDPVAEKRSRLYAILEAAEGFFRDQLVTPGGAPARQELASRGFTSEHADDAGCGYAPTDGDLMLKYLRGKGYTDEELVAAGLARSGSRGVFAFFRGRLLWPIRDARGRSAGFGARRLSDSDPLPGKYVNSPDSDVYRKSYLLYGLDRARKAAHRSGRVIVVEGYTDVMAYRASGVDEVVATCGTAFGVTHLSVLSRAVGEDTRIVFCFDGDAAGVKAAAKAWGSVKDVLNRVYGMRLRGGVDPCNKWETDGPGELASATEDAVPLTRMVVDDTAAEVLGDHPGPEERSRAVTAVGGVLALIPDEVVRAGYVEYAAGILDVPTTAFVATGTGAVSAPPPQDAPQQTSAAPSRPTTGGGMATGHLMALERRILHRLAGDPRAAATWAVSFEPSMFKAPVAQAVCRAVLAAGSGDVDVASMTPTAWAGRLLDYTDSTTGQSITRMLSEPLEESDVVALMQLGKASLEEHLLMVRLDQARAALGKAAGTPEEDMLLEAVVDLDAQLMNLRETMGADATGT